jgi:hypothetical protein
MDDLDRLAFRLVRTARASYPHLLSHGFSLTDVEERLLPFREARREMANGGADSWEVTVLRLLSGERDYVIAEPAMQSACRQALQHPSPSLSLVRRWASNTLMLGRGATSMAGAAGAAEAAVASAVTSAKASGVHTASPRAAGHGAHAASAHGAPHANAQHGTLGASAHGAPHANAQHAGQPHTHGARTQDLPTRGCRYCGGRLPDGRVLTFCPHCGLDLTKRQCPACSTEMEMGWRFCVTCGRGADGAPVELAGAQKTRLAAGVSAG